jgi:hypothetical protein
MEKQKKTTGKHDDRIVLSAKQKVTVDFIVRSGAIGIREVLVVVPTPPVEGNRPENHHLLGALEKLILRGPAVVEEVTVDRVTLLTAKRAKEINPYAWTQCSFSATGVEDNVTEIRLPAGVNVYTFSSLRVLVKAQSDATIEIDAFIIGDAEYARPVPGMKLELVALESADLSYDEIAFELEKIARDLRVARPAKMHRTIKVGTRELGSWTVGR